MGEQEKKRHRAPTNYALFDVSDDDFSDFTPPAKKVKDLDCSISSSSENKISSSNDDKRGDDKRKHKSSHRDKDKERNSSSSSGKDKDKHRDKHKSSSREKDRDKSSNSKDREKHKSSSKDRERDKISASNHKSSSRDKERDKSSSRDKERGKSSSRDKERDKRSRSKDKSKEKEKGEKCKSDITVERDSMNKMEVKKDEKKDPIKTSRNERSRSRSQDKDDDKSQDNNNDNKIKGSNSSDESIEKCKEIEKNCKNNDGRIVEVCYDDIKFSMTSEASKGDQIFKAIPVSIGPLTSTQKSTPERRKPKERLTTEEKVFQRELEAALNISKLDVTVDPETLKIDENESEKHKNTEGKDNNENKSEVAPVISPLEVAADSELLETEEKGDESEKIMVQTEKKGNDAEGQNEELKVPKLIIKIKINENVTDSIQTDEIMKDNSEMKFENLNSSEKDMPVYELKKDGLWQELKTGNENLRDIEDEKEKAVSENIHETDTNIDTQTGEIIISDNKSKSCSDETKVSSDQNNSVYENPQPSTSTGFISGKRQRKTVAFKEESDSQESDLEDEEFSVPSDSKDSSFEISPIKKSKKESKVLNPKSSKKGTKNVKTKENKSINEKEKPKLEKENTNRISPRSKGSRKTLIADDDFDTEEFKHSSINSLKSNKKEKKILSETNDDMKVSTPLNVNSPKLDENISPQVKIIRKPTKIESDCDNSDEDIHRDSDDSEFKPSPKKKSKPPSKDKQNIISTENKESSDPKDDMKENNPINVNSPKIDKNESPQVKRSRKPTKIESDSDESDQDFDGDSDDSEFKPSPKKKSRSASSDKQNKTATKNKELTEKSKMILNTKSLPANTNKATSVLKTTPANATKSNITSKLINVTPIRSTEITPSAASANPLTTGMTKTGFSPTKARISTPTQARVSTGLVKTAFRSPLMNTSATTPNYIPRSSTTPEARSIGLRIGLSRNRAFKPLHPNLPRK